MEKLIRYKVRVGEHTEEGMDWNEKDVEADGFVVDYGNLKFFVDRRVVDYFKNWDWVMEVKS